MAEYPPASNLQPPLGKQLDRPWVDLMLIAEDSCREALVGVVVQHRDHCLDDDGARICPLVHEMNGAAGELRSVLQRLALNMKARKGGEECGVNIHDPIPVFADKQRAQESHEPREADQIDVALPKQVDDGLVKSFLGFK